MDAGRAESSRGSKRLPTRPRRRRPSRTLKTANRPGIDDGDQMAPAILLREQMRHIVAQRLFTCAATLLRPFTRGRFPYGCFQRCQPRSLMILWIFFRLKEIP